MAKSDSDSDDVDLSVDIDKLPPELLNKKLGAVIKIAERKQALEEMRVTNQIAIEKRIQDFKEAEALRLTKYMDRRSEEGWMKSYWRPAMAWIYALICLFDFVIAPIMTAVLPAFITGMKYTPWKSLTLENGGLIHLAFAAILGVTAYTRGQEGILKTQMANRPDSPKKKDDQ